MKLLPRSTCLLRPVMLILGIAITSACDSPSDRPGDGLPPDPGREGRVTIAGIDSDQDGLRDDVQRFIYQTYRDQPTRDALVQVAKPQLQSLVSANDKAAVLELTEEMAAGVECLYHVRGAAEAGKDLVELESVMLNTRARIEASLQADRQAGGETFALTGGDRAESCTNE